MGIANVSPNYVMLWLTLDSVPLRIVIKPKILKEALPWSFERRAQVESYVLPQSNRTSGLNLQCNILHSCKSARHFRSKDQAPSHGARHSRAGPPKIFVPLLNFVVSKKICLKHCGECMITLSLPRSGACNSTPYHSTGNSQCERFNQTIWKTIPLMI